MLFNSYEFLFGFLPLSVAAFYALGRTARVWAISWLTLASFAFYGAPYVLDADYGPLPLVVLAFSVFFNYCTGLSIIRLQERPGASAVMAAGIAVDLGVLAYFKYSGFLVENFTGWFGGAIPWQVLLPIGISFYTFTQIAFLVDARQGKVKHLGFVEYALFVTWFPHLVAGPILHHSEMIGQFKREATVHPQSRNIAIGLAVFSLGLAKKILIADSIAPYANMVFDAPERASLAEAWLGALAYTLQLYFDFSGYSDMAIGISRLFNVDLPLNFFSPYKATSIIEFWRRWHISLSRFLRDYLYIPLGGNRAGTARRYANLMITMVLGGLWHGAAWTFVAWGALHGIYLLVNHCWRLLRHRAGLPAFPWVANWALTFVSVVIAWVFFRAPDFATAIEMLSAMAGLNAWIGDDVMSKDAAWLYVAVALLIALLLPNSQQLFHIPFNPRGSPLKESKPRAEPSNALLRWLAWRPSLRWAVTSAVLLVLSVSLFQRTSEFIYFRF
jgi:alginate O-acetyltransferase complex protein AlgI